MLSQSITFDIDPETARVFAAASPEERRKLQLLLRLRLRELTVGRARSLEEIMDEIGKEAEARGLTPDILESLMHGE